MQEKNYIYGNTAGDFQLFQVLFSTSLFYKIIFYFYYKWGKKTSIFISFKKLDLISQWYFWSWQ